MKNANDNFLNEQTVLLSGAREILRKHVIAIPHVQTTIVSLDDVLMAMRHR